MIERHTPEETAMLDAGMGVHGKLIEKEAARLDEDEDELITGSAPTGTPEQLTELTAALSKALKLFGSTVTLPPPDGSELAPDAARAFLMIGQAAEDYGEPLEYPHPKTQSEWTYCIGQIGALATDKDFKVFLGSRPSGPTNPLAFKGEAKAAPSTPAAKPANQTAPNMDMSMFEKRI